MAIAAFSNTLTADEAAMRLPTIGSSALLVNRRFFVVMMAAGATTLFYSALRMRIPCLGRPTSSSCMAYLLTDRAGPKS